MPYVLRDSYGREYPVYGAARIGRDPTNAIPLADPLASGVHAMLWEQQGFLYIRNEPTANVTFVNGVPVQEAALRIGDQIQIGNTLLFVGQGGPPQAPPRYTAPPARKRSGGCGTWVLLGCLLTLCACAAVGVGGFVAYQNGFITANTFLNLVGLGPGDVEVNDFRDDAIQVYILQLDVAQGSSPTEYSLELKPFDVRTTRLQEAGRYRIDFGTTQGSADLGTCTLKVKSGGQYQFIALPDKIVVNDVKNPPSVGTDLVVGTSSLCR